MIFGYCRISRKTQSIERQVRNILEKYPTAKIYKEEFSGTRLDGRKELNKILKLLQAGDVLIFDSVSRMSRNADEGFELYKQLYDKGVDIVFLKEPHCNSEKYREALERQIDITVNTGDQATNTFMNTVISALNQLQMDLARKDIELAFQQAQKEVDDLHIRTSEGIETARRAGKQIGQKKGAKLQIKKKEPAMQIIRKHSRDFEGNLTDTETMKLAGISRNTFYHYKKELAERLSQEQQEA